MVEASSRTIQPTAEQITLLYQTLRQLQGSNDFDQA